MKIYSFLLLCVTLGAITGCSKDQDIITQNYVEPNPNPLEPDMVFVQRIISNSDFSFSIGMFTVTQAQWAVIMGSSQLPKSYGVGDNYPMHGVSWDDSQVYITKLNELTGMNYRLPTEDEWEYAACGGNIKKGYKYSGSNNIDDVSWYYFNIPNKGAQPVGRKTPNELGIYDMSGNVWEWCSDFYIVHKDNHVTSNRNIRGGSWDCNFGALFVSNRSSDCQNNRNYTYGFRLAHDVE